MKKVNLKDVPLISRHLPKVIFIPAGAEVDTGFADGGLYEIHWPGPSNAYALYHVTRIGGGSSQSGGIISSPGANRFGDRENGSENYLFYRKENDGPLFIKNNRDIDVSIEVRLL